MKVQRWRNRDLQIAVLVRVFNANSESSVTSRQFEDPRCTATSALEESWEMTQLVAQTIFARHFVGSLAVVQS